MNHLAAFQNGLLAAKAGKKMIARIQFEQVAELNPDFIHNWLWLAWTADSPQQAQDYLLKAEKLDPNHRLTSLFREVVSSLAGYAMTDEGLHSDIDTRQIDAGEEAMDSPYPPFPLALETKMPGRSDVGYLREDTQDEEDKLAVDFAKLGDDVQAAISVPAAPHRVNTIVSERASEAESDTAETVLEDDTAPTILAVDDSPTVRKLVTMTLKSGGYNVKTAEDGVEAMKMLTNITPSLILLDVNMPRMDGYKLCKLIKRHDRTKFIPVVMLSGKDGMFDKLRGTLVGCDDYISKPFRSADLLSHVEKYLLARSRSARCEAQ